MTVFFKNPLCSDGLRVIPAAILLGLCLAVPAWASASSETAGKTAQLETFPLQIAQASPTVNPNSTESLNEGSDLYFMLHDFQRFSYGPDEKNVYYLAHPPHSAFPKANLVVLVHGGSFLHGSATDISMVPLAKFFLKRGYTVASIDYRSLLDNRWPTPIVDIANGIKAAQDNLGDQVNETTYVGFSAGAVAGSLLLYSDQYPTVPRIDRFIGISGLYNIDAVANPPALAIKNQSLENLDIFSVLKNIDQPKTHTPALLIEGSQDFFADKFANTENSHAVSLQRLLTHFHTRAQTYWTTGDGFDHHEGPLLLMAIDDPELSRAIENFLGRSSNFPVLYSHSAP